MDENDRPWTTTTTKKKKSISSSLLSLTVAWQTQNTDFTSLHNISHSWREAHILNQMYCQQKPNHNHSGPNICSWTEIDCSFSVWTLPHVIPLTVIHPSESYLLARQIAVSALLLLSAVAVHFRGRFLLTYLGHWLVKLFNGFHF